MREKMVKFVWEYDLNGTYRNTGRPDFTDTNRKPYRNPYGNALFDNWYDKDNSIEIDEYTLRRTPDHLAETNGFGEEPLRITLKRESTRPNRNLSISLDIG